MGNLKIRAKLIILFIIIKVIPLLIIAYIAVIGAQKLDGYFSQNTIALFKNSEQVIQNTAELAISDSIKMLDNKSQTSLEKLSYQIANQVAEFLYERDNDLKFLASIPLSQTILKSFYDAKRRPITIHEEYHYDDSTSTWQTIKSPGKIKRIQNTAELSDNQREFHFVDPLSTQHWEIPIYKEVVFFDLAGQELYKVSQINPNKRNISKKSETYISSETYFKQLQTLEDGDIYVSDVIGEYLPSKIIGHFSKQKAQQIGIKFEPEKFAYAGKENPVGKVFEGIIRFITPVFEADKKVGYISLALDHRHIMEFTDSINPTSPYIKQEIADASLGNYAFMWDYEGKNISHPRDYFIVGYDKQTGERVPGWISADLAKKYKQSQFSTLNEFLDQYPPFEEQSLNKKPNLEQLQNEGSIALDCRYLNFAPQCQGWMQLTEYGGYGSFIIYWSNVWKLTTAATIPYYTGKYNNSKRGFGFVTIGANVDEFHHAANQTKESVDKLLKIQTQEMKSQTEQNQKKITQYVNSIVQELSMVTLFMVIIVVAIAIWMSNYLTVKISRLLIGTQKFAHNQFDYRINITSRDEIGELENSFNEMAARIKQLMKQEKQFSQKLEEKVSERTKLLKKQTQKLEDAQVKLREMAYRDPLTDLYNRRYFEEVAKELLSLAKRENDPLGVLMIDIDKFKNINDTHGHDIGDIVLVRFAQELVSYIRESDLIARIGGEEFSIILPKTSAESVQNLANIIREKIQALEIEIAPKNIVQVTVSIGASMLINESDKNISDVIKRADEALYKAKSSGRNKVIISS